MNRLCLDIQSGNEVLRYVLFEQHAGMLRPRGAVKLKVPFDEVDLVWSDLCFLFGRSTLVGEMGTAALEEIRRLSSLLYDLLIPVELKPCLHNHCGELILQLSEDLQRLPWEMLHTGDAFLSHQCALSRSVIPTGIAPLPRVRQLSRSRSLLLVSDPRADLPAAATEGEFLGRHFAALSNIELGLLSAPVAQADLRQAFREYDIVHYAGHADASGWRLTDAPFGPSEVAQLAGTRPMPALVFANACSSAVGHDLGDRMAMAFLAAGVQNFIGTIWAVPDEVAVLFAHKLYEGLESGASIAEAMRQARLGLATELDVAGALWGSYVLYGDPQARYFEAALVHDHQGVQLTHNTTTVKAQQSLAALSELRAHELRLRHAAIAPPVANSHVKTQVNRLQRVAIGSLVTCALLLLAIGGYFFNDEHTQPTISPPLPQLPASESPNDSISRPLTGEVQVSMALIDSRGIEREARILPGDTIEPESRLGLRFVANHDAYAYVFFAGPKGVELLFPTVEGDLGEISGEVEVALPSDGRWYELETNKGQMGFLLALSNGPMEDPRLIADDISDLLNHRAAGSALSTPFGVATARIKRSADWVRVVDFDVF